MKLHLNLSLRRALLATMIAASTLPTSRAGVMHDDVTFQTYTDFGQNRGRYVVGSKVNALLSHIRTNVDKGITIHYTDGTPTYTISNEQGMISFNGTHDGGHSVVIGPNFIATVEHNGSIDGTFSERTVGSAHALNYEAVDIRNSSAFRLVPDWGNAKYDYMLQRQSKVVTDVTWNPLTTLSNDQVEALDGSYLYHSGSGTQYRWNEEQERMESLTGAYVYIIGAINTITNGQIHAGSDNLSLHQQPGYGEEGNTGASEAYPLPNGIRAGDSGSPTFIYNSSTGQYEYIAAQQSGGGNSYGQARGNIEWTVDTLKSFDATVDMSSTSTVYLGAVSETGETITDGAYSTTLHYGLATDAADNGNVLGRYYGVQTGTNTWGNLSYLKDKSNWYAYENVDYTFGSPTYGQAISDLKVGDADLFYTQNLVFTPTQAENNIILKATVDLGIGYAEFNKGEGMEKAEFHISAAEGTGAMFNHAGYVINEGAEVHLELNNSTSYMTEWRKVGAGDLYIDGTGDTNALLNLGGSGTTYLQQTGGHAAYNVLASSGARVVIGNTYQIKRDFTFGAGGGTLDLSGNSMDWYTSTDADGRFTINALTEEAIITNSSRTGSLVQSTLTYKQSGNTTYAGSFQDSTTGTLQIVYDAGQSSTWTLNSLHTDLSHWGNSGLIVNSGKVILSGTNTIHGMGSVNGKNATRYTNADDWHYADAKMNIEVANGATFELGSHARLQGSVYLYDGGTFVIREGVKHQHEYVEGGAAPEDTYQYAEYYGYKGANSGNDIYLAGSDSSLKIQYSAGTTANTTLGATIYGKGSVSVDAGTTGGTLTLSGSNGSMSGTKALISGGLIATTATALGNTDTNKWVVQEKGWIASTAETGATLLSRVDSSSTGVLALSADTASQLDLSNHQGLYIGAQQGKTVNYGTAGEELNAVNNAWKLGGGGGTLKVHFRLTGANDLIIGNEYSGGTVHLTNTANDFTGNISILGTGNILTYEDGALGDAHVALSYGNTLALHHARELGILTNGAQGVLAATSSMDLDLTGYSTALGAAGDQTFTGTLTVSDKYRFGGIGNLTLDTELDSANPMEIDGQGNTGSSVTLARENAYTGDITAGGGMQLDDAANTGSIGIHAGHENSLAKVNSLQLKKGAVLYTDGNNLTVNNLSAGAGASLQNNGNTASQLSLNVTQGTTTSIADGVLSDSANGANLTLVKTGTGTLEMGGNSAWSGGLIIEEGRVAVSAASGGTGSRENTILINPSGTLQVTANQVTYGNLGQTILNQKLAGTGTIEIASGGNMLLTQQDAGFEGTVHVTGNTRLYVGKDLTYNIKSNAAFNTAEAFDYATIQVDSGSQVRITNNLVHVSDVAITSRADYIISGTGMAGKAGTDLVHEALTLGALSIDCDSTITGNVHLADDATIASHSVLPSATRHNGVSPSFYGYYRSTIEDSDMSGHYGVKNHLGGTIRGIISGEGKTLTIAGNESMTFTADSANTYGELIIANGNGSNDDQFALRLDGGKAVSQTSTALGKGNVTLNDGLILRLAGTGTANNTNVVYTYANGITAGNGATLQSHNITNRLTGTVSMSGSELNLATANGGVLELAGGITGSGTLNIGAASKVILGDGISSTVTFGGNVVAGAGADFTLESASSLTANSTITGTDSLTLHLSGTSDYTLGGIAMSGTNSALTLHFDFTQAGSAEYITLNSSIASSATSIAIDLNMFNDITEGNYTLVNGSLGSTSYTLADTYGDRLSLVVGDGTLTLKVGSESRLYWASDSASQEWNSADNNWLTGNKGEKTAFSGTTEVMFTASGLSTAGTRESISVSNALAVGKVNVSSLYEMKGEGSLNGTKLAVGDGGDLKLGVNAAFSEGVQVNDGTLTVEGKTLTANVSAENGAVVNLNGTTLKGNIMVDSESAVNMDAASITGAVSTSASGSIALTNARLSGTFSTDSGATVLNAENLVLSEGSFESSAQLKAGSITVAGGSFTLKAASDIETLTVNGSFESSAQLKAGSITVAGGSFTLKEASDIETLAVNAGQTATLYNIAEESGKSKKFGVLQLADNATLAIDNRANTTSESGIIGTLQIGGNATIKETYGSGHLTIDTLTLADGVTSGTINLHKSSTNGGASYTAMFDIGSATAPAGNFVGEVVLANTVNHPNNSKHSVFINLYGKETLAHAVVKMNEQKDSSAYLGLGINADNARIGGLESSSSLGNRVLLFSGYAPQNIGWNTGDGTDMNNDEVARTLIVDTAEDAAYTYHGQVMEDLSLVKDGAGKQTFSGNSAKFNGSIEILDGTLAFTGDALGMLGTASSVAVNGGTLDISSYDFSTGLLAVNNFSFSEDSVLALGNLTAGTTYDFFTADSQLDNWISLTTDNFTIGGVSLSDMGRVSLSLGLDGSFSYTLNSQNLTWNGSSTGTWDFNTTAWQTTDASTGEPTATGFVNSDNVIFKTDASIKVSEKVAVNNLIIEKGASLSLSPADGASLLVQGAVNLGGTLSIDNYDLGTIKVDAGQEGTLEARTATINTLDVANGATLNLKNGVYTFTGDIGSAKSTGVVNFYGSAMKSIDGQNINVKGQLQIMGNTSVTINRKGESVQDYTEGLHVYGTLSVEENAKLTMGGNGRTTLEEGGTILLKNGASMERSTSGSYWIAGSLKVAENATATFKTTDSIWMRSGGSIDVLRGATLNLGAVTFNSQDGQHDYNINIGNNATLNSTGTSMNLNGSASVNMAKGGRIQFTRVEYSNKGAAETATLKSGYVLTNGHAKSTGTEGITMDNKLVNSSVENAGTGTLTINNSGNTLTGLHATGGNINVSAAASLDLTHLVIAAQKSITAAASMSVASLAQFESGATLNADLTLATGATVNLGGEDFTLNGALTLQTGLTLGGNALEAVKGLAAGESYTLFSGVTNLQLEQAVTLNNMRSLAVQTNEAVSYKTMMNEVQASAADYFSNLSGNTGLMLSYNSTDGSVSITQTAAIPEPSTSTLSLLALSALAARRRRK